MTIRKNVKWTQDSDPQLTASLSEIERCMENYKDYLIIAKNENEIAYGLITGFTISGAEILKKIIMAPNKPVKLEVLGKQVDISSLGLFFPVSTHCDLKAVCEIVKGLDLCMGKDSSNVRIGYKEVEIWCTPNGTQKKKLRSKGCHCMLPLLSHGDVCPEMHQVHVEE